VDLALKISIPLVVGSVIVVLLVIYLVRMVRECMAPSYGGGMLMEWVSDGDSESTDRDAAMWLGSIGSSEDERGDEFFDEVSFRHRRGYGMSGDSDTL
jgi:hypothetical protein